MLTVIEQRNLLGHGVEIHLAAVHVVQVLFGLVPLRDHHSSSYSQRVRIKQEAVFFHGHDYIGERLLNVLVDIPQLALFDDRHKVTVETEAGIRVLGSVLSDLPRVLRCCGSHVRHDFTCDWVLLGKAQFLEKVDLLHLDAECAVEAVFQAQWEVASDPRQQHCIFPAL